MQNDIFDFEQHIKKLADQRAHAHQGFFGPHSVVWQINRERINMLSGLRAILMQVAHPAVAQGVADHSNFEQDTFGRLNRTMEVVHSILFDPTEEALKSARRVYKRHRSVQGTVGQHSYYANNPALLLWVYATLIDSLMHGYQMLFPATPQAVWHRFYIEIQPFGYLFGIPEGTLPKTLYEFNIYVELMLCNLEVTPTGYKVAQAVLRSPHPVFGFSNRVLAAGTLPESLLVPFGIPKTRTTDFLFSTTMRIIRRTVPLLPAPLRYTKKARRKF